MILRLWRGRTAPEQSAAYEQLLTASIAPGIMDRQIPGLRELHVLRRHPMDLDAVSAFTGGDPTVSVVPPSARSLLSRFDEHSMHYTSVARFGR